MVLLGPVIAVGQKPPGNAVVEEPVPSATPSPDLNEEFSGIREEIGALWTQLDQLSDGDESPPWAKAGHERLDQRLERATTLLERLSARVETPVPRLDEPFTLLTVSLCAFVLGLLAGRILGRRGKRRDSRFGP